jgi:hypothetical protein
MAYGMAGVNEPRKEIHVAEPYDPFDYKELHHLEGLLLFDRGKAPEAAAAGVTARDGDLPCCPSGGLLGVGNPIAAAGLMKIAELFWQLRGEAGARQVPGTPERGVAQAWGDLMQVGTVVVMGSDGGPPATASQSPPAEPRATSLSDQEFRSATGAVEQRLDVRYDWDTGEAVATSGSSPRPASHAVGPSSRRGSSASVASGPRTDGPRCRRPARSRRSRSAT